MEKNKKEKEKKVPYYRKPDDLTVEEWQIALRKQFAMKQDFQIRNIGNVPVFSDFKVFNPASGNSYKVAIRSYKFGDNFCSCPDFKTNELGTCKHIEFVLKELKDNTENDRYWEEGNQRIYSSISLRYGKTRRIFLRLGETNADSIRSLSKKYFDNEGFLLKQKYFELGDFINSARELDPEFRIYHDALEFIIDERGNIIRKQIIDEEFPEDINSKSFDTLIRADLYPYQKEGILKATKAGRIIIADDMGLGKTIQAIACSEILAKHLNLNSVLIICPTSLKYQWQNEIEKFTDRTVKVVEGNLDKRIKHYRTDEFYKIASYGVGLNDIEYLNENEFDLVILDEAQRIKNWKTKTAQGLKKLNSQYAIVMTGTPLENKLDELHSIVEFIDPYKLGALFRFLDSHQLTDESGKVIGYKDLSKIREVLDDIIIRRTKAEILDQLPDRIDKNIFVNITQEQFDIHDDYQNVVSRLVNKWRRFGFLSEKDRQRLLMSLSCMRMVSDSTYILDQETRHDKKIDELIIILKEIFESGDEKVVIFSQWERMTRLVGRELRKMDIGYEYLHGGIPSVKRKDLIDNFREDKSKRVFLSTDAGGVGLNLQSANIVINMDLPWNPAVLEQRIARVHRLGQSKKVQVINFISKGTIEQRILGVIGFKKSMFEGVLDGGDDQVIMDESKFKKLMKSVEDLDEVETEQYLAEDQEVQEVEKQVEANAATKSEKPVIQTPELKPNTEILANGNKGEQKSIPPSQSNELAELLTVGAGFISKLGQTLNKLQTGEININNFIEKDEVGKTSIKIPVENEKVITNTISQLAGLFGNLLGNSNKGSK
ncbi:MAG: DEAD/DEAH box helicase [Bacteroidetes bacterium]|jgi:SNF2 family DNA or RNA helicase|nr:DEAD/DEAH box helicase [Bacteroidota bacterium]MBT6836742.1 DEAD/DEAH box helicase [Bacteroidota bacterium]MBT7041081.1 DEAD/DEAH box helicase [Bacteroidota bacterium]MBT7493309.1 DEAD/DEAH box helicase [Bacteroidota bacterium]